MSAARTLSLSLAIGLVVAACGGSGSSGGSSSSGSSSSHESSGSGTGSSSSAAGSGGGTSSSSSTAASSGSGGAMAGKPKPPHLEGLVAKHPGLQLTWSEPTPCDMVLGERSDVFNPYTPMMPLFMVPGATTTYLDVAATGSYQAPTMNQQYTYRARCKTAGGLSDYSNELAANPTM